MRYTRDKIEVTFGIVNKTLVEKVIPALGYEAVWVDLPREID